MPGVAEDALATATTADQVDALLADLTEEEARVDAQLADAVTDLASLEK